MIAYNTYQCIDAGGGKISVRGIRRGRAKTWFACSEGGGGARFERTRFSDLLPTAVNNDTSLNSRILAMYEPKTAKKHLLDGIF